MNIRTVRNNLAVNPATEPAVKTGVWGSILTGVWNAVNLIPNFIPDNVYNMVNLLLAVFLPIITAVVIRGKVWSPKAVLDVIDEASAVARNELNNPKPRPSTPPTIL